MAITSSLKLKFVALSLASDVASSLKLKLRIVEIGIPLIHTPTYLDPFIAYQNIAFEETIYEIESEEQIISSGLPDGLTASVVQKGVLYEIRVSGAPTEINKTPGYSYINFESFTLAFKIYVFASNEKAYFIETASTPVLIVLSIDETYVSEGLNNNNFHTLFSVYEVGKIIRGSIDHYKTYNQDNLIVGSRFTMKLYLEQVNNIQYLSGAYNYLQNAIKSVEVFRDSEPLFKGIQNIERIRFSYADYLAELTFDSYNKVDKEIKKNDGEYNTEIINAIFDNDPSNDNYFNDPEALTSPDSWYRVRYLFEKLLRFIGAEIVEFGNFNHIFSNCTYATPDRTDQTQKSHPIYHIGFDSVSQAQSAFDQWDSTVGPNFIFNKLLIPKAWIFGQDYGYEPNDNTNGVEISTVSDILNLLCFICHAKIYIDASGVGYVLPRDNKQDSTISLSDSEIITSINGSNKLIQISSYLTKIPALYGLGWDRQAQKHTGLYAFSSSSRLNTVYSQSFPPPFGTLYDANKYKFVQENVFLHEADNTKKTEPLFIKYPFGCNIFTAYYPFDYSSVYEDDPDNAPNGIRILAGADALIPSLKLERNFNQIRFVVSGVTDAPGIGAVYSNNSKEYIVSHMNIVDGSGSIDCDNYFLPENSGQLIKVSGSGDETIAFSSYEVVGGGLINSGSCDALCIALSDNDKTHENPWGGWRNGVKEAECDLFFVVQLVGKTSNGYFPTCPHTRTDNGKDTNWHYMYIAQRMGMLYKFRKYNRAIVEMMMYDTERSLKVNYTTQNSILSHSQKTWYPLQFEDDVIKNITKATLLDVTDYE